MITQSTHRADNSPRYHLLFHERAATKQLVIVQNSWLLYRNRTLPHSSSSYWGLFADDKTNIPVSLWCLLSLLINVCSRNGVEDKISFLSFYWGLFLHYLTKNYQFSQQIWLKFRKIFFLIRYYFVIKSW